MCDLFDSTNESLLRAADQYHRALKMRIELKEMSQKMEMKTDMEMDEKKEEFTTDDDAIDMDEFALLEKHLKNMMGVLGFDD